MRTSTSCVINPTLGSFVSIWLQRPRDHVWTNNWPLLVVITESLYQPHWCCEDGWDLFFIFTIMEGH